MARKSKIQPKLTDKELISLFVEYLVKRGRTEIKINSWPDEENRRSSDIDAIAGHFAIEHSSFDTLPNQRRDSAWFKQVVEPLENKFSASLPFRLVLTFPYEAIRSGQDWSRIRDALRVWILDQSQTLTIGSHNIQGVPGIPFEFRAVKKKSDRNVLLFARFVPDDKTFSNRLRKKLAQRIDKLSRYKNKGMSTILLVESDDIALMNDGIMWDGLKAAYPDGMPEGVDEIWFADTSIPEEIVFTEMTEAVIR